MRYKILREWEKKLVNKFLLSPKQFEPFPKQAPDLMCLQYTSFERLWEKEKWFVLDGVYNIAGMGEKAGKQHFLLYLEKF